MADFTPIGVEAVVQGLNKFTSDIGKMNQSIGSVETTADKVGGSLGKVEGSLGSLGKLAGGAVVAGFAAATAAAAGLAVALGGIAVVGTGFALEVEEGVNRLQAQFGLTAQEAEKLGEIGKQVFKNNFAESVGEATVAVGLIQQQLGELGDVELQSATENAFRLRDAFGIDLAESMQAVKVLTEEFGLTQQQAFDFISTGFQEGLNSSGDFIDSISEYGQLFGNADATASQFFSVLETGLAGGVNGTDRAADAFKEFQIRFIEGNAGLVEAFGTLGLNYDELVGRVQAGEITITDVFGMVTEAVGQTDMSILSNQEAVAKLGTQFEDLGSNAVAGISLATTSLADMEGATLKIDALYQSLPERFEAFKRGVIVALEPVGVAILNVAEQVLPVFVGALEQIVPILETSIVPAIVQLVEQLAANMPAAIETASALWTTLLQPALMAVGQFIQDVAIPAFNQLIEFLSAAIPAAVETASVVWTSTLQPAISVVGEFVMGTLIPAITEVISLIGDRLPAAGETASTIFSAIQQVVLTFAQGFSAIVLPAITSFVSYISANLPAIQATVVTVFEVAKAAVIAFGSVFMDSVIPNVMGAVSSLTDIIGAFGLTWGDIWEAVGSAVVIVAEVIGAGLLAIIATFTGMATAVTAVIENVLSAIRNLQQATTQIFEGIVTVVANAAAAITALLQGDIGGAVDYLQAAFQGILDIISGIWDAIIATMQLSIGSVLALVGGFVEGFVGFFVSLASQLTDITGSMVGDIFSLIADGDWAGAGLLVVEGIGGSIRDGVGNILSAISDVVNGMIDAFTGVDWSSVGSDVIDGIIAGVDAAKDSLFGTLADMARSALDSAKSALGIGSPSKVFADEVGKPIVEGWALGVEENSDLVTKALHGLFEKSMDLVNKGMAGVQKLYTSTGANILSAFLGDDPNAAGFDQFVNAAKFSEQMLGSFQDLENVGPDVYQNMQSLMDLLRQGGTQVGALFDIADIGDVFTQNPVEMAAFFEKASSALQEMNKDALDQLKIQTQNNIRYGDYLYQVEQAQKLNEDLINSIKSDDATFAPLLNELNSLDNLISQNRENLLRGLDPGQAQIQINNALAERTELLDEIAAKQAEILEIQEKEAALKNEQSRLKFLQDQQKLIEDIRSKGFNEAEILGGFQVGVEADMGEFLAAMTRFTSAMITQTEQQLGIASPSKVFKSIGEQTMAGLTQGIMTMGAMPAQAMQAATGLMTQRAAAPNVMSSQSNTFNTTINSQMDAAQFQAMLNRSLSNAIQ